MSKRDEINKLMQQCEADGKSLTATMIVEAAKNETEYPALNKHLWQPSEALLAQEARITRAHRLLIQLNVTTGDGITTRMFVHTRGVPGYQALNSVVNRPDLALAKLRELTASIASARGRLRSFRAALPEPISDEIDEALERAEAKAQAAIAEREPTEAAA